MTIARVREEFGVPGPWLFRLDIPLTSGCRIALIHDNDGELVLRMMVDLNRERREYTTPKVRVEVSDLMVLLEESDLTFRMHPIEMLLRGEFADVKVGGKHAGGCPRGHLAQGVKMFLYVAENSGEMG